MDELDINKELALQARYEKQMICLIEGKRCSGCEEDCRYKPTGGDSNDKDS